MYMYLTICVHVHDEMSSGTSIITPDILTVV